MNTKTRGKWYLVIIMIIVITGFTNIKNVNSAQNRLSGRILLQVEQNGEAWYVNPDNQKRYFLGRPADAFALMRELGLGVSEVNYKKFEANNNQAPSSLSGKILLRVENNGEAYYVNPVDLKMYYLGRPADAFGVMRNLGLGITDKDLGNIDVEKDNNTEQVVQQQAIIEEVIGEGTETVSEAREVKTYVGSGTYDFGEGDILIDPVNNKKFVQKGLYTQYGSEWLQFSITDLNTGQPTQNQIKMYLDPEKLYTGDDEMTMVYGYQPTKNPLYFMTFKGKNPDGTYKFSFDFYLAAVLGDNAVGEKDILVVPVYFDDEYEVFDQFELYRNNFMEPAFDEIKSYLKVKQLEFLNEEIMTVDFTIADAIKLVNEKKYFSSDESNGYFERKEIVNNKTKYSHDDFDVVVFIFYTEEIFENIYGNTAIADHAMIKLHQSPITEYELSTPIQIHQKRNIITTGLLHEILHVYGMSDTNGSGKRAFFEGVIYDGTQKLEDDLSDKVDTYAEVGRFQGIDELVANEIGWCDENNNGIWDANEFYEYKTK